VATDGVPTERDEYAGPALPPRYRFGVRSEKSNRAQTKTPRSCGASDIRDRGTYFNVRSNNW